MVKGSLLVVCLVSAAVAQESGKQFREREFEAYQTASNALNANKFQEAVHALDTWKENFPQSSFSDEREALFVQAYAGLNEPVKALDTALPLLTRDLHTIFPGATGQPVILRLLYSASWAIARIPNPTDQELTAGRKAAQELMSWDQPLPGVSAAKWAEAKKDMQEKASAALLYLEMLPGIQAMSGQPPDCAAAETAYTKALGKYAEKSAISYELGRALMCEAKEIPEKASPAIYEFERAAVIDPTLGGVRTDPKQIQTYADSAYVKFHGGEDGLVQLKQSVRNSPLPPAGFSIKSAADIAAEKSAAFESANPELALWDKLKSALSQPDGEQYFENGLNGTAVPELRGKLIEAKPACRPRELLIAVPLPGVQEPLKSAIRLKLDKPLAGKPDAGESVRWQGVPSAFSKDPFLLTMDVDASAVKELKLSPCTAAGAKRSGPSRAGQ